jgi:hypothetical protein
MIDSSLNGFSIQDSLQVNPAEDSLVKNSSATTKNKFSIKDSLEKYSGVDSFYKRYPNGDMLNIVKANKTSFAAYFFIAGEDEVWEENFYPPVDSLIFFNKKQGGQWLQTDSVMWYSNSIYENYGIEDLNGDGFSDFVFHFFGEKHGENLVFIFNKKTRQFEHNGQFDLENICYDSKSKFVRSRIYGGLRIHGGLHSCSYKMRYRVVGENLKFDLGAEMCPDGIQQKTASLRYYTMKNGEEITIKLIKGSSRKIDKLYTKAIWDSSLD